MSVRIYFMRDGEEKEGSVEDALVYSGKASTRMMKYLIALTEILIRKGIVGRFDLQQLARAYQVRVHINRIEIDGIDRNKAIEGTVIE